ncbi:polysaccharide biosynthesis protein [Alkaliphilus crotonatoxidans]
MFAGKTLLITGGTGSFGNAVLNRFLKSSIKEIRIFSRDEKKQSDMRIRYQSDKIKFYIGDIRDYNSIYQATKGVDYIFNAAALKQVPSCEFNPMEAVKTNIIGTNNVLEAAIENGVKKVIGLSTDKAVYPINAMGQSKALMEKLIIAKSRNLNKGTLLSCVRYGNVLATRGSIVPRLVEQIKQGECLTITNPQMTRFLMSMDDAINLVIHAFKYGHNGEIFVLRSPAATVADLAQAIKEIFKIEAATKIIGIRHGEKYHETLVTHEEMARAEELKNYYIIKPDDRDLNYGNNDDVQGTLSDSLEAGYNSFNAPRLSVSQIKKILLKLPYIKEELKEYKRMSGVKEK